MLNYISYNRQLIFIKKRCHDKILCFIEGECYSPRYGYLHGNPFYPIDEQIYYFNFIIVLHFHRKYLTYSACSGIARKLWITIELKKIVLLSELVQFHQGKLVRVRGSSSVRCKVDGATLFLAMPLIRQ